MTLADAGERGTQHMVSETPDLHRVIVVGGGAGGLELVTRLGNKLGRYKRADVTLDRQEPRPSVEAAAA